MTKIDDIIAANQGIRLDIGCGANKQPNFVGMDIQDLPGVDIIHDLEIYPWPIPDERVIVAVCHHVLEHINPHKGGVIRFMNEVWRILKPDAKIAITMPHGASDGYLQDPTHCNAMNENSFWYFDPDSPEIGDAFWRFYRPKPWAVEARAYHRYTNLDFVLRKRPEVNHDE